jgi:uroporphyrinogen decarboxylase
LRKYGVKVIELDSDGNTEPLIPLLIEAGINCHWPLESAADMDPVKLRREYGKDLAFMGGIDKRELAKDKRAIEEELRRKVLPILESGGYIPTVDHTVPPEVPLENFLYYLELKRRIAEKGAI